MIKIIRPEDIAVYVYEDASALPRGERLAACAEHYADWRGLPAGRNFTVEREPGNKPFFPAAPQIHFSVSHSGEYWLCAFHGAPLGLDVQKHSPRAYEAIAKRWYHPDEYAAVLRQGSACFFDIWCAKESFCKLSGQGINSAFAQFSVVEQGGGLAECCRGRRLRPLALFFGGYSACLCAAKPGQIHVVRL